ncbi:MAG: CinA family nicotinamide mononucleotide deamidase-related protein [Bacteroidales bacterium]
MRTEVITIGDELLIGQVIDTNSAWIGKELNKIGLELFRITSVGDDPEDMLRILQEASGRSDVILITGGIGPTKDDRTKQVLADFFGMGLRFDNETYNNVERIFRMRGREVNTLSRSQANVLDQATIIQNQKGTAPISWIDKNNQVFVSMPGVPIEMKWAMTEEIIPRLLKKFQPEEYIIHRTFLVKDYTESGLAEHISEWEDNLPLQLKLAYLPSPGIIRLRLTCRDRGDKSYGEALLRDEALKLKQLLKEALFEEDDLPIGAFIGKLLKQKKLTFATAESCTGGYIAHQITAISGSSTYFKGGIIAYSNEVKENLLCVKSETLLNFGAVSRQVAEEMVLGVKELLKVDAAVAVTGIAGPDGGTEEKPVGTVWIASYCCGKLISRMYRYGNDREQNIIRTANDALLLLAQMIEN